MTAKSPYDKADRRLAKVIAAVNGEFRRHMLRNFTGHDEINVLSVKKDTARLYKRLDRLNRRLYLRIAREVYEDIFHEHGKEPDGTLDMIWLLAILENPDEVTGYIYTNEIKRKRDRFFESLLTINFSRRSVEADIMTLYKRARDLWNLQTEQYEIGVVDYASRAAYRELGVRRLRWNTQRDKRVCKTCCDRDGRIYDIDNIPASHYRCRCFLSPP